MKSHLRILAVTAGIFFTATGFSQTTTAPAAAPSASVSSPSTHAVKESTNPGLKTPAGPHPATTALSPVAPEKTGAAHAAQTPAPNTPAVGGGHGKVWATTASKTYHCEGTKYYGNTKDGKYMSEAEAKAKGFHADHGKACAN